MNNIDLNALSFNVTEPAKLRHDINNAIISLQMIGDLIESGYQFNHESSDEIKQKYKQSVELFKFVFEKFIK